MNFGVFGMPVNTPRDKVGGMTAYASQSGTFIVPDGVYRLKVTLTGGGGTGASHDGTAVYYGGGSGATGIKYLDVVPGEKIPYTAGAAAAASSITYRGTAYQAGPGTAGTNSPGAGGTVSGAFDISFAGGTGGAGSNITSADAVSGFARGVGGNGAASVWGGGGAGGNSSGARAGSAAPSTAYGAGGGGAGFFASSGGAGSSGAGAAGCVIFEY